MSEPTIEPTTNGETPDAYIHVTFPEGGQNCLLEMENVSSFQLFGAAEVLRIQGENMLNAAMAQQAYEQAQKGLVLAKTMPQDHLKKGRGN